MGLASSWRRPRSRDSSRAGVLLTALFFGLAGGGCSSILGIDGYTFEGDGGSTGTTTSTSSGGSGGTGGSTSSGGSTTSGGSTSSGGTGGTSSGGTGGQTGCSEGQTETCYSGPDGTLDVGPCKAGSRTCDANGTWGPCVGDVLPGNEVCDGSIDDDCDGQVDDGCICAPGTVSACYSGPAGTAGVGPCKTGSRTCLADGMGYSACSGEIVPAFEQCGTGADENCDGVGCVGQTTWAKIFGDAQMQGAPAIAVDAARNILFAGHFSGQIDLGGGAFSGSDANFVAKLSSAGDHVWSKNIGGAAAFTSPLVAADASSNAIVAGTFNGTLDFGGGMTLTNNLSPVIFLAELDPSGAPVFARQLGGAGAQSVSGLSVAPDGGAVVVGTMTASFQIDGTTFSGRSYIARFAPNGTLAASKTLDLDPGAGAQDHVSVMRVTVDPAGNVTAVGQFRGDVDFGGGIVTSKGVDAFVLHLDPDLKFQWVRTSGGAGVETCRDVTSDAAGNVYALGVFSSDLEFGVLPLISAGSTDVYVVKMNSAGTSLYGVRFGDADVQDVFGLTVDAEGNVSFAGYFLGTVVLGGTSLVSQNGNGDVFLAKLDPVGAPLWARTLSNPAAGTIMERPSVQADALGAVVLTGMAVGPIDLGTGVLTGAGNYDLFLARLTP